MTEQNEHTLVAELPHLHELMGRNPEGWNVTVSGVCTRGATIQSAGEVLCTFTGDQQSQVIDSVNTIEREVQNPAERNL